MSTPASGATSNSVNNGANNGTGSGLTHGGRTKSRLYAPGITAGAEDVKYAAKYKDLKRKVKEIEADNDKILFKLLQAKRNIQRAKLERAILYERLAAIPASPPQSHQNLPPPPPAQSIVQTHSGHGLELAALGPQPPIDAIHLQHTHAAQIQPMQSAPAPVHPQIHGHNRQPRHSYSGHSQQSPPPSGVVLVDVFPSGPAQVLVDADGRPLPRDWRFVQAQQPEERDSPGEIVSNSGGQIVVQQSSQHERHLGRSHGHSSSRRRRSRSRDQGQQQHLEPTYFNSNSSPHIRSRSRSSQPISASSVPPPLVPAISREWSRDYQQRDWEHGRNSANINIGSRSGSPPPLMDASVNIGSRRHDLHELTLHNQMSPPPQLIPSRSPSTRHHIASNQRPHNHHLRSNASGRATERERGRDNSAHTRAPTPPFALHTERPYEDYNMDSADSPPHIAAPSHRSSASFSSNPTSHQTRSSGLAEYERDRWRGAGARLSDLVNAEPESIHRSMSSDSLNNRRMHMVSNEENDIRMDIDNIDVGSLNGSTNSLIGHGHVHGISHQRAAPPEERDRDRNRGFNWTQQADRVLSDEEPEDRDRGSPTDATTEI